MRATGLMLSSEAICPARRSAKTATPQGAKDRASQQGAMPAEQAEAQDRSTSSRFAQLDRSCTSARPTGFASCWLARSFAPSGVAVFADRRARHVASLLSIKPVARICLYNDAP